MVQSTARTTTLAVQLLQISADTHVQIEQQVLRNFSSVHTLCKQSVSVGNINTHLHARTHTRAHTYTHTHTTAMLIPHQNM